MASRLPQPECDDLTASRRGRFVFEHPRIFIIWRIVNAIQFRKNVGRSEYGLTIRILSNS